MEYNKFKEGACGLNDDQNIKLFSTVMQITLDTRGKEQMLEGESEDGQKNRDQKRMYSYKQLFDLHKILNNNSDVHDRTT